MHVNGYMPLFFIGATIELNYVLCRVRVAKNYLSSGGLDLSQDDISKLNEYDLYRSDLSKSTK